MIYAIEVLNADRFIKIGVATLPAARFSAIQSSCPYELRLMAVADWPDIEEQRIHIFLERSKVRGEWYKQDADTDLVIALLVDPDGLIEWQSHAPGEPRVPLDLWVNCE